MEFYLMTMLIDNFLVWFLASRVTVVSRLCVSCDGIVTRAGQLTQ